MQAIKTYGLSCPSAGVGAWNGDLFQAVLSMWPLDCPFGWELWWGMVLNREVVLLIMKLRPWARRKFVSSPIGSIAGSSFNLASKATAAFCSSIMSTCKSTPSASSAKCSSAYVSSVNRPVRWKPTVLCKMTFLSARAALVVPVLRNFFLTCIRCLCPHAGCCMQCNCFISSTSARFLPFRQFPLDTGST